MTATACVKRTGAAASVERRLSEPSRAATPVLFTRARTHSLESFGKRSRSTTLFCLSFHSSHSPAVVTVVLAEPLSGGAFESHDHFIECPDVAPGGGTHTVYIRDYVPSELKVTVPIVCVHGA